MTAFYAFCLGVVQGLSEFLPISSSGHLILAREVFGWNAEVFGVAFDVACHAGTLLAVVAYFRVDLFGMIAALRDPWSASEPARLARRIVVGTVPVVLVGLALGDLLEQQVRTPGVALWTLTLGGLGLLVAERATAARRAEASLGYGEALLVGMAQALALVPGVSRSGATMTVAMLLGVTRPGAARLSFLLGVPAIAGAAARTSIDVVRDGLAPDAAALFLVGLATSAVVGYLTIRYFLRYLAGHRLDLFGYYRIGLATVVALWLWAGR